MDKSTFRSVCWDHGGTVEKADDVLYCRDASFDDGTGQFRWTDGYLENEDTGRTYCERDTDEAAADIGTDVSTVSGLSDGESVGEVTKVDEEQVMIDSDQIRGDAEGVAREIARDGDDSVMVVDPDGDTTEIDARQKTWGV